MRDDAAAIWVDPGRMGGQPCIYGHQLTTGAIARLFHDGADVLGLYPEIHPEQIAAAVMFEQWRETDLTDRLAAEAARADGAEFKAVVQTGALAQATRELDVAEAALGRVRSLIDEWTTGTGLTNVPVGLLRHAIDPAPLTELRAALDGGS